VSRFNFSLHQDGVWPLTPPPLSSLFAPRSRHDRECLGFIPHAIQRQQQKEKKKKKTSSRIRRFGTRLWTRSFLRSPSGQLTKSQSDESKAFIAIGICAVTKTANTTAAKNQNNCTQLQKTKTNKFLKPPQSKQKKKMTKIPAFCDECLELNLRTALHCNFQRFIASLSLQQQ
jgi:hypothetical protein